MGFIPLARALCSARHGMSYGLNISASGLMTTIYTQDVYANNLANMDTPGFKPDIPTIRPREAVTAEDGVSFLPSNTLLERLGGGTLMNPNRVDFSQGSLKPTPNALDFAIEGNGFFVVRDSTDIQGDRVRLTRDGRFARGTDGSLVTATGGMPVLDVNDRPIRLERGPLVVNGDGAMFQNGRAIAQLKIIDVPNKDALRKADKGQFIADSTALQGASRAGGTIRQNTIEDSAADEIRTLVKMTSIARDVEFNSSLIQAHDRLSERAINGLGRVA